MKDSIKEGVVLYGAGGHCRVVIDILTALGAPVGYIVDDFPAADTFMGHRLMTPPDSMKQAVITIGNCKIRKQLAETLDVEEYPVLIHPSAIVSPSATVGEGTVIVHGAVVQTSVEVGRHCILNTRSVVEHDSIIHDFVHVASGAVICGGVDIGEGSWIGAGSVVKQGVKIGRNCMIGAGSVVVKDIPDNVVAYGNPCRVMRPNDQCK